MTPFHALHQTAHPLLLPTAWDAASALSMQAAGARAIATSSAALAWSLGWPDGDNLPMDELLAAVRRLVRVLAVPLSVDAEAGYSRDPEAVAALAVNLAGMGVAGINLEDGNESPECLAAKIAACRRALGRRALFINARTDVFLRGLASGAAATAETLARLQRYRDAGADGAFVPGLTESDTIATIAQANPMPLNVMAAPDLPDLATCTRLGVRRLSAGPWPMLGACGALEQACVSWLDHGGAWPASTRLSYGMMNDRMCTQQP
ncbi:MAG: isocitrate lyase/phosphoenolpyruvate mutase family protein [Proteobacteria bacterium]|nr:isocitrate lyase/phosphoenolpyruvate mutase family protein [Pseudomonadota bacterium]